MLARKQTDIVANSFETAHWWESQGPSEMLHDNLTSVFDLTPIDSDENLGLCRARSWLLDGLLISQAESDATIARRNKWQAENCEGLVFVHRYLRGGSYGVAGDLAIHKGSNEVYLADQALRIELVQTSILVQGLHLSKSALGFDSARHPPMIRFDANRTIGRVLNAEMDRLFSIFFQSQGAARYSLQRLINCLKVAIHSPDQDGDVRRQARDALGDLIFEYIERHLASPDLSVDLILRNFGVSRASLFRIFEPKGGVRQYISDRRLYRAIADITHAPSHRGSINAASEKWGFSSIANFNRAVKRKFGVPPKTLIEPVSEERLPFRVDSNAHDFFG